ncbi:MAG: alcohol dehydrogenase catalytic domain-containing protein [Pirellulales bacterium]|nr:alcohol dehydrogenase catalytic domain-containing protein [Pirellulales bacterium]
MATARNTDELATTPRKTTMKAVEYHGPGNVRVVTRPVPTCGTGEILVKVDACAVCGTDLKTFLNGNPRITPPMVMGHEFTGLIETVDPACNEYGSLEPGDRVVMATSISCGQCYYCHRGWTNLCLELAPMGFAYPGGMAEYVVIPEPAVRRGHVVRVPEGVKAEHAALAEPLSCAVNSCVNSAVSPGDTVVVIAAGPLGVMNACVARGIGAARVILVEVNPQRLRQAKTFGFDMLIDPTKCNLVETIRRETGGLGADVVIVAAPAAAPQEQAVDLVRKRGTVCLFASLLAGKSDITFDSRTIHYNELKLVGTSDSTPEHVRAAVEMLVAGTVDAQRIAGHILPLDGILEAFELMQSGQALRVVLRP